MKWRLCLLGTIMWSCLAGAESFLPGTQDVPQMDGLIITTHPQVDFDTPVGQILTFDALSKTKNAQEVISFYQTVLPQMGWQSLENDSFVRDKDTLSLTVLHAQKPTRIRFDIVLTSGF